MMIMKKTFYITLFLLFIIEQSVMAQRIEKEAKEFFKNEYGVDVNNFDEYGKKHGLWYNYVYTYYYDSFNYKFIVISKGNYSNGIKTGKWIHFYQYDNPYSGYILDYSKVYYYYEDKSQLIVSKIPNLTTFYSSDSLLITSVISNYKNDTLTIECVDKRECYLFNNECELIFQFIYSEFNLDFVQTEIGMGFFRRLDQYKWLNE